MSNGRLTRRALFSGSIRELLHPPSSQIPFLDGLRAIAVLLVINQHMSAQFAKAYGANSYSGLTLVANGWIGVDLFFVLSGFFIGGQLWKELRDRGTISVSRFVMRRGFRIWPLYFFIFLCVLTFAMTFGGGAAGKEYGWSDLIFITNFHNRGLVMGSWSLCTEEQFYIVTPLALYFLSGRVGSIRSFRLWLWVLLFSVPGLRAIVWIHGMGMGNFFHHSPDMFNHLYYSSLTHCDGLIIGLIIANLWIAGDKPKSRFATPAILALAAVAVMIGMHWLQKEVFDFTALALFFGSMVWMGLNRRITIFNSRVFYWLSRLSFGMYLNHEYMCPWIARFVVPRIPFSAAHAVLTNLTCVVVVTLASALVSLVTFSFVEYPFLQIRKAVLDKRNAVGAAAPVMSHS